MDERCEPYANGSRALAYVCAEIDLIAADAELTRDEGLLRAEPRWTVGQFQRAQDRV